MSDTLPTAVTWQTSFKLRGGFFGTTRHHADGRWTCFCGVDEKWESRCDHVRRAKLRAGHLLSTGRRDWNE